MNHAKNGVNIFHIGSSSLGPEDRFTSYLHYVIDTVPTVGQEIVNQICRRSGLPSTTFVCAIDHPDGDAENKPDFLLRCVEFDILCEHKLESDLGYKQLERYIALPAARPTYLVLISNRNHVIADEVIRSPVFLKPQGAVRPYFYWEHLFPAVSNSDSRLAQDFAAYMCSLGMAPCLLEGGWKDLFADQAAAENFYAVTNRLRAVFEKQGARSQADPSRLGFQIKPQIGTIHMLYIQAARFVKPAIPALAPPHLIAKVYVKSTDTARLTARENSAFSIATGEVVGRWVGKTASWNNELILSYEYIVALNDLLAPDSAETRDRLEQFGLFLNNELFPHEEAEPGV